MGPNETYQHNHNCTQKERIAILENEAENRRKANGDLRQDDKDLSNQMATGFNKMDERFDKLLFWMLAALGSGIVGLVIAITALLK